MFLAGWEEEIAQNSQFATNLRIGGDSVDLSSLLFRRPCPNSGFSPRCKFLNLSNQTPRVCITCVYVTVGRLRLKCDDTRAETRFRLSAKRTSPFKSAGASVLSTTGSRGVRFSVSNAGYTMFRGSVKSTGYPLHSPFSPSLPLPCVTACHHVSTGLYTIIHT